MKLFGYGKVIHSEYYLPEEPHAPIKDHYYTVADAYAASDDMRRHSSNGYAVLMD